MPVPVALTDQLVARLLAAQNSDGGWGYSPGKESRLEPTAWILLAFLKISHFKTYDQPLSRSHAWLRAQQLPDGGFRSTGTSDFSRWQTALAAMALTLPSGDMSMIPSPAQEKALQALLEDRAQPARRKNLELGGDLVGWGWTNNAFSWIEPTAYARWALQEISIPPALQAQADWRCEEAEKIFQARRCTDGGWNYGNTSSSDYALGAFPVPTALTLLALQKPRLTWDLTSAWRRLDELLAKQPTLLALSLGCIAAASHHRPWDPWLQEIPQHLDILPSQANWGHGLALYALSSSA